MVKMKNEWKHYPDRPNCSNCGKPCDMDNKYDSGKVKWRDMCLKMASILQVPELVVQGDGSKIFLVATDTNNSSADQHPEEVGTTDKQFQMVFKIENMKLLSGNYEVGISSKGISHFSHEHSKLQYWIATEQNSTFNG